MISLHKKHWESIYSETIRQLTFTADNTCFTVYLNIMIDFSKCHALMMFINDIGNYYVYSLINY